MKTDAEKYTENIKKKSYKPKLAVMPFVNINNDEDKIAFVLKPNEVRVGNCDNTFDLNIFSRDMINSKKETTSKFYLSNIKVIEVY